MKLIKSLFITSLLAFAIVGVATPSFAQEKGEKKTEEKAKGEGKKKGGDGLPAGGKVKSVDKVNKTITVGERVFAVTSETKISKDGKPATLDDVKDGEEIGVYYKKDGEKLNALTVRVGPRPEGKKKEPKKEESK